jgi:uncharacterized membrane protein YfcA
MAREGIGLPIRGRKNSVGSTELVLIALLGLTSGLMIGCIGIGGVILVPALVFLADIPIKICISAAMAAFILSGLVATAVFASHKSIHWGMAIWLCTGAAPAAFVGAWGVSIADPRILEAGLGLLTFASGLNSLRRHDETHASGGNLPNKVLLPIGAVTGFLSSVSGTGGPLVLVPILMSMSIPVLTAVGLSQAVQLPVAMAATFGNVLYGKLDLMLGGILAATLTVGSWYGARLAHVMPRTILRGIVSAALVIIGAFILGNVGWRLLG